MASAYLNIVVIRSTVNVKNELKRDSCISNIKNSTFELVFFKEKLHYVSGGRGKS